MKALTRTMGKLYKSYLFTVVVKDLKKLADMDFQKQVRKAMKNVDFDKKYWLRKAGLTPYTPKKDLLGSGMLFIVGAAIGAVAGLALAPAKGDEFREKLRTRATGMIGRTDMGETQAPAEA